MYLLVAGDLNSALIMENPYTHGKPDIVPEPIEIDLAGEVTLRYLRYDEYPAGCNWWNYCPLVEFKNENT